VGSGDESYSFPHPGSSPLFDLPLPTATGKGLEKLSSISTAFHSFPVKAVDRMEIKRALRERVRET
jgi:hypothetical protein